MRICVIGDSSVAALKVAWDRIGMEMPHISLTFFAAPGRIIGDLAVEDGMLVARSDVLRQHLLKKSGGLDSIDPAGFDAYMLSGMQLYAFNIARARREFPHKDMAQEAVLEAACGTIAETIHGRTVQKVRECAQNPLAMLPRPSPVIDPQKPFWDVLMKTNSGPGKMHLFESACERFAARMNSRFVPQPRETVGETGLDTQAVFARAPACLSPRATDDLTHMNGDYGEIVLRAALAALS
jgi:hypothetical protein